MEWPKKFRTGAISTRLRHSARSRMSNVLEGGNALLPLPMIVSLREKGSLMCLFKAMAFQTFSYTGVDRFQL